MSIRRDYFKAKVDILAQAAATLLGLKGRGAVLEDAVKLEEAFRQALASPRPWPSLRRVPQDGLPRREALPGARRPRKGLSDWVMSSARPTWLPWPASAPSPTRCPNL